jgi:hypothetical protein
VRAILGTWLRTDFAYNDFGITVLQFFIANSMLE